MEYIRVEQRTSIIQEREREQAGTRETFFSKCPPPDSFNRMEELVLSFFDTDYRRPAEKFS